MYIFQDINRVEASFEKWGKAFTYDCKKENRGTHDKWFTRVIHKINKVAQRTRIHLKC